MRRSGGRTASSCLTAREVNASAQADAKTFALQLEFGQTVVPEQRDQLTQFIHVHGRLRPGRAAALTAFRIGSLLVVLILHHQFTGANSSGDKPNKSLIKGLAPKD